MLTMNQWDALDPNRKRPTIGFVSSPDFCQRCMSAIWHLWTRSGFTVRLDPEPLDFKGDLECYLAGRHTFKLWRVGPYRFEVDYRLPIERQRWDGSGVVLAEHICDPDNIRTELPDYWKQGNIYEHPEEAPF